MRNNEFKIMQEMSVQEAANTVGGISIIRVTGAMDGIKGNTEVFIFGIRVFHGKNVD